MMPAPEHYVIAPILIPFIAGTLLLFFDDRKRHFKAGVSLLATVALLGVSYRLLEISHTGGGQVVAYLLGNWPPPFAINLVLDRLSAIMLMLTAVLAIPALIFSFGRWHKAGLHFHTLFLLLLMGLNGAFLTGDLFNLFVFFEVMLAASYGLVLHGSGLMRVKAGLHYIAINLTASLLFLIGVALIYGAAGTLNMADLSVRIPQVAGNDRVLLEVGMAILGVAFLIKAGMWPLGFWLPTTYTHAAAPVAAVFAIMSKVGIYVLLRLSLLFYGEQADDNPGSQLFFYGGLATIIFGIIGVLASQSLGRFASFSVLVSSGTLLAAISFTQIGITAGALFYLVSSTLAISAFFMLIELVEEEANPIASILAVTMELFGESDDEDEEEIVGIAIPGAAALLGISFVVCSLTLAGLPPFSGFIAKFVILAAILNPEASAQESTIPAATWWFIALLVLSGLAALIALVRAGMRIFWVPVTALLSRVLLIEIAPIVALLSVTLILTVQAGSVMRFMEATAASLHKPESYIEAVLEAPQAVQSQMEHEE
ncbi:MAG: monovalent cation/H+ antiporter subunit D [Nitrosomonas sp.]|nr:monovalent cation/H+ antiporter subunit D [Nitrosomonas sp.]